MVNTKCPPIKRMSPVLDDDLIYVVLNTRGECCIKDRWLTDRCLGEIPISGGLACQPSRLAAVSSRIAMPIAPRYPASPLLSC